MTCTRSGSGGPGGAAPAVRAAVAVGAGVRRAEALAQDPAVEADRERPVLHEGVVEVAQRERVAEARLLVGPKLEQQDLAEQVGELVGRRRGVATDLGASVRHLAAGR